MEDLQALVDRADDAALLAAVDGLCASRQWDALADLARRCRDAVELGKQLWPVAMHIDYRLALEGPPLHAARTLVPGAGRFTLGPLTEVAASTHTWEDLAEHLAHPVTAATVAQERVLRGQDLRRAASHLPAELPLALAPWEPSYALPRYRDRSARFPSPPVAAGLTGPPQSLPARPADVRGPAEDPPARALAETVAAWSTESSGRVRVAAVEGRADEALAALADDGVVRAPITADAALGLLQWAGASGGSKGRRPGGAAGRFAALWSAASLAGIDWPEDPADPDFVAELGAAITELEWLRWRPDEPEAGWVLRLAVADPVDGLAWAIDATDAVDEDDTARPEPA